MRWKNEGRIKYVKVTNKIILYNKNDIMKVLNQKENKKEKINVIYCRVSNTKQKKDLNKQEQILLGYYNNNGFIINEVYKEIASGMNEDRIQLNKLINKILNNEVDTIFITYKDRLTRFRYKYF